MADTPQAPGKLKKRVRDLLRFPADYDFEDLKKILEAFGFTAEPPRRGSHWVFYGPNHRNPSEELQITIPVKKGRKVKRPYLKRVAERLLLEEWLQRVEEER